MCEPNLIEKNVNQRVGENQRAVPVALSQNCLKHFTKLLFRQLTACLQLAEKCGNNGGTASEISSSGSGRNLLFQPQGQWNLWRRNDHCNSNAKTVSKFNQCSPSCPGHHLCSPSQESGKSSCFLGKDHSREPSSSFLNPVSLRKS